MSISSRVVTYREEKVTLEGYVAYCDHKPSRAGVLVFPDWRGVAQQVMARCDMLAELGYAAFAADVYGKDVRPLGYAACEAESAKYYSDRILLKSRAKAALAAFVAEKICDAERISSIGYCFGALTAIELARTGAALRGVVSFHGNFNTPAPGAGAVQSKFLILHGDDDPLVPPEEVSTFLAELKAEKIDYQFVAYANQVHSFTNWDIPENVPGASSYSKLTDQRSWSLMTSFLEEMSVKTTPNH